MQMGGDASTGNWLLIILMTMSFVFILAAYIAAPTSVSVYNSSTKKAATKKVSPSVASRVLFAIAMAFNIICVIICAYVLWVSD